jgi:formylglycine-generating enzyme required for sulfatase activity
VEQVSWDDAVEFCRRLRRKEGVTYRLPTEAEWEYACRAGTTTPFSFGSVANGRQANCKGDEPYGMEQKGPNLGRTTAVGSYAPNAFGLYDMQGNVWQWCADWYGERYYDVSPPDDPRGPDAGSWRILRGGSWGVGAEDARSAVRVGDTPDFSSGSVGFRVARTL